MTTPVLNAVTEKEFQQQVVALARVCGWRISLEYGTMRYAEGHLPAQAWPKTECVSRSARCTFLGESTPHARMLEMARLLRQGRLWKTQRRATWRYSIVCTPRVLRVALRINSARDASRSSLPEAALRSPRSPRSGRAEGEHSARRITDDATTSCGCL